MSLRARRSKGAHRGYPAYKVARGGWPWRRSWL